MKHIAIIAILLLTLPAVTLAEDDILTTAASNGSFKTLVGLVVAADLDDALQGKGDFTVFAPTDEAFAKLPAATLQSLLKPENREQLVAILKYHVLPSAVSIPKRRPSHPLKSAKTLLGERVRFERNGSDVKVNDANVVIRNIRCSNGIIQVIDNVLLPPQPEDNSIVGAAKKAGNFKTLLAAVEAAGLGEALSGKGPLTVFAPTDKAFKALPKGTLKDLLKTENKDRLATILKYHVVAGKITARDAVKAGRATTLADERVNVSIRDGRIRINDATVISNDIETSNGIIHVIDQVLLPENSSHTSNSSSDSQSEITITASWNRPAVRDGITADRINIRCSGGASVRLTNVTAKEIVTRIGGGGSVSISGTTVQHTATVSGGGTLRARDLVTDNTEIRVNGGGVAAVNAKTSLAATANAGAKIRYVDTEAKITKTISKYADFVAIANANQHVATSSNTDH